MDAGSRPSGGPPPEHPDPVVRLREIMARLRDPVHGCPWDIEQDFASIAPYTIEEAYEVADAIARQDWDDLEAELGDLLLQAVYHARIGAERGLFDLDSIARRIGDKMIERHPHVFAARPGARTAEAQARDWEARKEAERARRGQRRVLDGVALGLPALLRALKLQRRMARVGFDWPDIDGVVEKIAEEARELAEAREAADRDALEDEFGDLLFSLVNLARHLGIDPEAALRRTNAKIVQRFETVEDALAAEGLSLAEASLEAMEAAWNAAKSPGAPRPPPAGGGPEVSEQIDQD